MKGYGVTMTAGRGFSEQTVSTCKGNKRSSLAMALVLLSLGASMPLAADTVQQVKDINTGVSDSLPKNITAFNGLFYFSADDGSTGAELWVSDGTDAGTALLKDIKSGNKKSSSPEDLVVYNGSLYFSADDGLNGRELWVSDGTAAGTVLFKDIHPGTNQGASPSDLTVFNGKLYFSADDGVNGRELWESDGTAVGTVLNTDIQAGSTGSSPTELAISDGKLYFQADGGVSTGQELWVLTPALSCEYPLDATEAEVLSIIDGKLIPSNADQTGTYTVRTGLTATEAYVMFSSGFTSGTGQTFDVSSGVVAMGLSKDLLPDVGAAHGVGVGDVAIQFAFFDTSMTEVGHVNYQYDATGHWLGVGIGPGTDYFYQTDGSQVSFWFDANTGTFGVGYRDPMGNPQLATRASYTATTVTPVLIVYEQASVNAAYAGQTVEATMYSDPANITAPVPAGAVAPCGGGI